MEGALVDQKTSPLATVLADPERLANIPVETLERLLALQERYDAEQARRTYFEAFARVQGRTREVAERGWNPSTRSKYALLEDIKEMLDPILAEEGFAQSVSMVPGAGEGLMRFELLIRHSGGHSERHHLDAPGDDRGMKGTPTKTALHGMRSSMTYCRRALITDVWDVRTCEPDDDGNAAGLGPGGEPISEDERAVVEREIERTGSDAARFCKWLGVDSVADIRRSQLPNALAMLRRKGAGATA